MMFEIKILHDRKRYRFQVEQILFSNVKEQFKIRGKTTALILESNRPLFRNKAIKHRIPNWKKISGDVSNTSLVELIVKALMDYLEPLNKIGL